METLIEKTSSSDKQAYAELIEKSLSGDEHAYAKLIELVKPDLYKVARTKLRSLDDIDDAFQETILKSYKNLNQLNNRKSFKSWIVTILKNECNNINYKYNRNTKIFNKVVDTFDSEESIYTIDDIDNSIFMDELFSNLTDDEKEIAYLHFRDNFTAEKIANILNSNKNTVKSKIYRIRQKLQKLAMFIIILCIITTTTVFAIKFIVSLFTTSRQAIDTAVENDYVQNVDMNFTYDKDIGIKVDYILIDNKNLNVSYIYDCNAYKDVNSAELVDYTIKTESNHTIYSDNLYGVSDISNNYGTPNIIANNFIRHSNLYTTNKYFPISNKLIFDIRKISVKINNEFKEISGNWTFEINLEDKFLNRTSENYMASYSEYIENISTTLEKTSLIVDIEFNTEINKNYIYLKDSLLLKNNTNHEYDLTLYEIAPKRLHLVFDISTYTKNINTLNLYIKFDESKYIDINLIK